MEPERVDAVAPSARRMAVGDTARRTRTVSTRDIELFTEITGDRNPLHYDQDLARRSRFGGIVVQGWSHHRPVERARRGGPARTHAVHLG
jgi:acyl dehydratase